MPIAVNPDNGSVVFLDDAGAWQPAKTAVNPQSKEMLAYDGKTWAPVPQKSKGVLGYVDDAVRSIASGMTFGYADEIAAKANTMFGGKSYEENLTAERARDKQISPAIAIPGEVAGGIASAIAAAPVTAGVAAASGLARLPQLARYAGVGAGTGALYGSGNAEGDRTTGALAGAGVGAPLGVAAPYAIQGLARTGQAIRGAFSPGAQVSSDLGRAILRDADTPAALAARTAGLQADRPGVATLADAGGENVRGLLERVAQTPGAGRTTVVPTLTTRQQGQMGRLANDLRDMTGTRQTAVQAIDETMTQRATTARPLYDAAMNFNAREAPDVVRAWENVTGSGWGQSILRSPDFRRTLQTEYGIRNPADAPLMVQIDAWKKQVDGVIGESVRAGNNNKARILGDMHDRMVSAVDAANPAYATARNAWAGPSRYMDAVEEGRNILSPRVGAEELTARVRGLSEAEQEAYRVGAVSAIVGKMGSDPARLGDMTKYLRSPEVRAKIAAIMPTDEAAQTWARRLDFEVSASELTGRSLGNSATARRLAERQDADSIAGDLVMDALAGTPAMGLWRKLLTAAPQRVRDTLRSRSDARLADTLLDTNPQNLAPVLNRAQQSATPLSIASQGAGIVGTNALTNYGISP